MSRIRKSIAVMMAAVILYGILGGLLTGVFAAEEPVNIIVDSYANGTLTLHWNQPAGGKAAVVTYHTPEQDNTASFITLQTLVGTNSVTIAGLKPDYIYDIGVTIYPNVDDSKNPIGAPVGRGLLFYLPSITFRSDTPEQPYTDISGGGRETGAMPRMKLSWKAPKGFYDPDNTVYPEADPNPANNRYVTADTPEALSYMQNSLRRIYNDRREISSLNYRINISTDLNLLNSGSSQAAVVIDRTGSNTYRAKVSNDPDRSITVSNPDSFGYYSFELWGRTDENSNVPEPDVSYALPNSDILPGSVYYMNIKPIYRNSAGGNVTAVTSGAPEDLNGSLISGERPYTSTPIRFQITKDSANNIYVKIYKINQGSLDLPRLYYEVQVSDDPSIQGDWTVKKTMDDSYFSGSSAVTVITGVNPNNEVYYKIAVKSDNPEDRLESPPMPYTLKVDTSRPPLPTGIAVTEMVPDVERITLPSGTVITGTFTNATISWEKPANWDKVKSDIYFHFLLSTSQAEQPKEVQAPLYVDGRQWGDKDYLIRYRLVKYISAESAKIRSVGNRLEYTLNAFDLFKGEGKPSSVVETISPRAKDLTDDPDETSYPKFLLPNTVYYLQMYTTKAADRGTEDTNRMSDRSIVVSFTTLDGVEMDVPLPAGLKLDKNGKDTSVSPAVNYVDITFDKVMDLHWKNYTNEYDESAYSYHLYYDLYMNSRTDTPFTRIGTTQDLQGDVGFTGADDTQSTSVKARISRFTSQNAVNLFGYSLLPNTSYYFKVRTRLVIRSKTDPADITVKESIDTAILPVTTIMSGVTPPDDSLRRPLAPTDFEVAFGSSGNQLLSGNSVTFSWMHREKDVIYQMIRTSQKVGATEEAAVYAGDPEYVAFLQEYDRLSDGTVDGTVYLDPIPPSGGQTHPGKFTYDSATGMCTYTVDRRMFPNKLYYFSLKAVRVNSAGKPAVPGSESVWVSIPITTSLIDAPSVLEPVIGGELGFSWTDATSGLTAEDYKVYFKGPAETQYKLVNRSQVTIIKDKDGQTYYCRLFGLKQNSAYDIKVTKGANTPVCEKIGMKTRDGYHEIEVMWIGKQLDNYSRYDIAIMEEGGSDYTVLTSSDLEQYVDRSGSILPYYPEETVRTVNSDAVYYHARIKSSDVVLPGGMTAKQPLKSNTKYYVKIRAVKADPVETDFISYSKYIGPISIRTEFNQGDYDNTDRDEQQEAVFLDRMAELEKEYFWRVAIGTGQSAGILLKGDRVCNALENVKGDSFLVDMTALSVNIDRDEVYIPVSVLQSMKTLNRSLIIRIPGTELMLRPASLDASSDELMKELLGRQEVKDLYVRIMLSKSSETPVLQPPNTVKQSDVGDLDVQAMGLARTDRELAQLFHDKLYDKENGLVTEKLNLLLNTYVGSGTGSAQLISKYTQSIVDMIEKELSAYIDSTIKSVKLGTAVRDITAFGTPVSVSMASGQGKGVKIPYVQYDDSSGWQKISSNVVQSEALIRFNLVKAGRFAIFSAQSSIGDVPPGHWAEGYVSRLASKYDLSTVFSDIQTSFMPDNQVTGREVVLLYELTAGKVSENNGLDIRQKNKALGLESILNPNLLGKNVKRQETAAILLKLFCVQKGVSAKSLKPGGRVNISDESKIGDEYFSSVVMIADMKVMGTDSSGRFNPENPMNRAEVVAAFVKLLELTGEM